jgi:predicted RNA-binding protein with TRAM domain
VHDVIPGFWDYGDDLFTLTEPLPAGLSFDDQTGTISGTPTEAWSKSSYQISVMSAKGAFSITKTFAINVHPKNAIVARNGQKTAYIARVDSVFNSQAPLFDNTFGTLTYAKSGSVLAASTVAPTTGVMTFTPTDAQKNTTVNYAVGVTDAFGRTGSMSYTVDIKSALVLTVQTIGAKPGVAITPITPVVTGVLGTASYSFSGLPSGFSGSSATGQITGTLSATVPAGTSYNVNVTVTDSLDGAAKTASFVIFAPTNDARRYWALKCTTWDTSFNVGELRMYNEQNVMVSALATPTSQNNYPGFPITNVNDGKDGTFYSPLGLSPSEMIIYLDFKTNAQDLRKIEITKRLDYPLHNCLGWSVMSSEDGVNYATSWTGAYSGWNLTNTKYVSVKP